jgi:hypothetical protein
MSSEMQVVLDFVSRQPCRCMSIAQLGERDYCDRCQSTKNLRALLARTEAGADGAAMAALERESDKSMGVGFDQWFANPYTAVLLKSIAEDYVPRTHPQDASGDAAKLGAFAASILNLNEDWIGDVDGGTLQDAAEKCGLLQAVEVSEPCGEGCNCAGYGDFPQTCYRPTETMKRAMQAKEAK